MFYPKAVAVLVRAAVVSLIIFNSACSASATKNSIIDADLRADVDDLLAVDDEDSANIEVVSQEVSNEELQQSTKSTADTAKKVANADISFIQHPSNKIIAQRQLYAQFLIASDAKDYQLISTQRPQLRDYPLFNYLDYANLRDNIATAKPVEVTAYIDVNSDNFLSSYMRGLLLTEFARQADWNNFAKLDDGRGGRANNCRRLYADIQLGRQSQSKLMQRAQTYYLSAKSQPSECDDVFAWYLGKLGGNKSGIIYKRIKLALKAGQLNFAKYLQKAAADQLSNAQHAYINKYINDINKIKNNAELIFTAAYRQDNSYNHRLALLAANTVLADDLERAEYTWQRLTRRYKFTAKDANSFLAIAAKRSAQRHYADALTRFKKLPRAAFNDDIHEWYARAAIRAQAWQQLLVAIKLMPKSLAENAEWLYWRARAEQHVGSLAVARLLYEQVAVQRSYYGFLAAERLGYNYSFNNAPSSVDIDLIHKLNNSIGFLRLREWLYHKQYKYARAELKALLRHANNEEKLAYAHMVYSLGWYEQAVRIMAQLKQFDDLPLRFPLAYRQSLELYAKQEEISADWAQAIMRRESGYAFDARSRVGATGLMQLMPNTAKMLARQQDWQFEGSAALLQPDTNIRYGVTYLGQLNRRFGGQIPLATAAYNAGPHRVNKWLPADKSIPLDIWISTIPFPETRKYVQAVSEYMTVFKWRAAGEPANFKRSLGYIDKIIYPAEVELANSTY